MYNPLDEIPNPDFHSLKDNIYKAIFNYKEPLAR